MMRCYRIQGSESLPQLLERSAEKNLEKAHFWLGSLLSEGMSAKNFGVTNM